MSHETLVSHPKPRPGWSFIAKVNLALSITAVALCVGIATWVFVSLRMAQAEVDEIVAEIRAAGDPMSRAELDAYYAVPSGQADLTADYLAAIRMFADRKLKEEEKELPVVGKSGSVPPAGEDWPLLPVADAFLRSVEPQLTALKQLAVRQGRVQYPLESPESFSPGVERMQQLREAVRRLDLDFQVRLHRGDRSGALEALHAVVALGESLRDEPIPISQHFRAIFTGIAARQSQEILQHARVTDDERTKLREIFQDVDLAPGLGLILRGERAATYARLQSEMTWGEIDNKPLIARLTLRHLAGLRPAEVALILKLQSAAVDAADQPLPDAIGLLHAQRNAIQAAISAHPEEWSWNRPVLPPLFLGSPHGYADIFGRAEAQRTAVLTALAVEQFRQVHDRLPDSIDELIPEFLAASPIDPFSGVALLYRCDEFGYVIYSVGPDGADNGGVLAFSAAPYDVGIRIDLTASDTAD